MAAERRWAAECACVFIQISFFLVYIRCEYLCLEGRPHACARARVWATDHSQESHRALLLTLLQAFLFAALLFLPLLSHPLLLSSSSIWGSPVRSLSAAGAEDKRAALGCAACVRARLQRRSACFARLLSELRLGSIQIERVLMNSPAPPRLCCCSLRGWQPRTRHGGEAEKGAQLGALIRSQPCNAPIGPFASAH